MFMNDFPSFYRFHLIAFMKKVVQLELQADRLFWLHFIYKLVGTIVIFFFNLSHFFSFLRLFRLQHLTSFLFCNLKKIQRYGDLHGNSIHGHIQIRTMEVRMRWMEITLIVLQREVNVRSRLTTITRRQLGGSTWGRWSAFAISIFSTGQIMRKVMYSIK